MMTIGDIEHFKILGALHAALADALGAHLKAAEPGIALRVGGLGAPEGGGTVVALHYHDLRLNAAGARGRPIVSHNHAPSREGDDFLFHPPPIELLLRLVVAAWGEDPLTELNALGRALQFFQENPRLSAQLPGGEEESFTLSPDPELPPAEVASLFHAHGAAPRLAVGYQTRVELRSAKVLRRAAATRSVAQRVQRQGQPAPVRP